MSEKTNASEIRVGVVGCGGFGLFALQHFVQVPGVRATAMAETHNPAAMAASKRFHMEVFEHTADMVARDDVDLVYIATPPFLHHRQALTALRAGKHVICEKPLAVSLAEADEMIAEARSHDLLLTANLMQRYNPLFDAIGEIIGRGLLGDVLHGYFENYAADEGLPPEHWFWDREKSGGIFIEHGVHFFDLFAGWLGEGRVESAQQSHRRAGDIVDQVQCSVRYRNDVLVNFYHGFHQAGRMDRQELRLVFERGDITLHEWIPTRYRVHAIVDEAQTRELCELLPDARLDVLSVYGGDGRGCRGRHRDHDVYQMIELSGGKDRTKMHLYGDLLRAVLGDQLAWVRDRSHRRRLSEQNGRDSLALAVAATDLCERPS